MKLLKKGDRVRLKVITYGGWKGTGTVARNQYDPDDLVVFEKDGSDPDERPEMCSACRHEIALLRNQAGAANKFAPAQAIAKT